MNCNKCGKSAKDSFGGRLTKVRTTWGYYSAGKDTLEDSWAICGECYNNLVKLAEPVCNICRTKVTDIMSALHARYEDTDSHVRKQFAFRRFKRFIEREFLTGCWEFSVCGGITLCEVCYENYTRDFKIPMKVKCYSNHSYEVPVDEFRTRLTDDPNLPKNRKKRK